MNHLGKAAPSHALSLRSMVWPRYDQVAHVGQASGVAAAAARRRQRRADRNVPNGTV